MKYKHMLVLLAAMLCVLATASREADFQISDYYLEYEGSVLSALMLPGDAGMLHYGSYPSLVTKGEPIVGSLIRLDAAGNILWSYTFPYYTEQDGSGILTLLDGRYARMIHMGDNKGKLLFFDKEKGFIEESEPFDEETVWVVSDGFIAASKPSYNTLRLTRLDMDGNVLSHRDYPHDDQYVSAVDLAATDDGGLMWLNMSWDRYENSSLKVVKCGADGDIEWQSEYTRDDVFSQWLTPTGDGGAIVAGQKPDASGKTIAFAVRFDGDGKIEWEQTIDIKNFYVFELYKEGDVYRIIMRSASGAAVVTLGEDGEIIEVDTRRALSQGGPPLDIIINQATRNEVGDLFLCGTVYDPVNQILWPMIVPFEDMPKDQEAWG